MTHPLVQMVHNLLDRGISDPEEIFQEIYNKRIGIHYSVIRKAIQFGKSTY